MLLPALRLRPAALVAGALLLVLAGCSGKSSKEDTLRKADGYFAAGDYVKAEIEYKNALVQDNTSAHVISRMGVIYFEQGRISLGFRFLSRAIELRPDDVEARHKLALFNIGNGKVADARQAAITILEKNPRHPEAPIILAEALANAADLADTRSRLARLPGGAAEGAPALVALALLEMRERKFKEAEALLERARKADPKFPVAPSVQGQIYQAQKDLARAEKAFAEAAALAPPRSQLRVQNARFQVQAGHPDVARRLLEESIAQAPDFLPPYLLLASIADNEKKLEEGIGLLDKVLAKDAEHPEALLLMGQMRLNQGEKERAIATLERAVLLYPRAATMHHQLGLAYFSAGNVTGAATSLALAIRHAPPGFHAPAIALARLQIRQGDFANAIKVLAPLARLEPEVAESRLLLAAALRGQGSLDESLKLYRQLGQSQSRAPEYRYLEGSVLQQQGQRAEARRAFAAAIELSPSFLPAIQELVNMDLADQQVPAAIARLQAYVAKNPSAADAQLLLASVYLRQPDIKNAELTLLKVIEQHPDNASAYAMLSRLYVETNQTEKAIAKLKDSIAKNPADVGASFVLGTLYEAQKNYPAARDLYEKVIAANPKIGQALNNLAHLYAEHLVDLDKALDAAQRAREAMPGDPSIADTLGWVLFKKRQYPRAVALLEEAAEKIPDNADIRYHLGMAYYMSGREADARRALEQALKLKPDFSGADEARQALAVLSVDAASAGGRATLEKAIAARKDDPVAHLRLAALHEREGQADKALAAYDVALKSNPALVPAVIGTMRLQAARNETAKAIALGREARKLVPADTQLSVALGRLAYQTGDFAGSLALLQDAARRQPDDTEILFELADSAYSMGQLTATENALGDALRAAPSSPRAAKARAFLELLALAQNPADAAAAAKAADAALKADANSIPALMVRAALDERAGNTKAAQQAYEKALARFPDFTPAKRRLAILWSAQPELPKNALEFATKAREAFPGDPELARAFGVILFRQGNFVRAAGPLQESARTLTNDAELMYYIGRAQHETKDAAGSKRSLQRALDLGLKGEFANEARRLLTPAPEKK